jgi:mannosyl-oligosaccharide alpha-1,2-mannosidase
VEEGKWRYSREGEAMYLLWKTTGDSKWRERGWKMFDAINRHTRNEVGYTSVHYTNNPTPRKVDDMPR